MITRQGKACRFVRLDVHAPRSLAPLGIVAQMATLAINAPDRAMRIRVAFFAGFARNFMERQHAGRSLGPVGWLWEFLGNRVASGAVRVGMFAFEHEDIVVLKQRSRVEGGLVVTVQAGPVRGPGVDVHVARQAILAQPQEARYPWPPREIGQSEDSRELVLVALVAGQAIMLSRKLVRAVRMIEGVRVAVGPGQGTDQRKGLAMVLRMARSTAERLVLGQECVVPFVGVELAGDFRVARQAPGRQSIGRMTPVAGMNVRSRYDPTVREAQWTWNGIAHEEVTCQGGRGDDAEGQRRFGVQQHYGRLPRIQRSPKRTVTTICSTSAISRRMASQRCRKRHVWSRRLTEGEGSWPRICCPSTDSDRRK
jgi:hypothetical protein